MKEFEEFDTIRYYLDEILAEINKINYIQKNKGNLKLIDSIIDIIKDKRTLIMT